MSRFDDLGPNSGLVEELYQRYLENPASVDAHWRDYFDRQPASPTAAGHAGPGTRPGHTRARRPAAAGARRRLRAAAARRAARPGPMVLDGEEPEPLRGAAARTVENMEASLGVPTATSVRVVPAKLLEVNRQILNNQLARTGAGQGQLHPPHRVRGAARARRLPRAQLRVRHRGRQARRRPAPAREPRARGRRADARRHALAARAQRQGRRHARLRRASGVRTRSSS